MYEIATATDIPVFIIHTMYTPDVSPYLQNLVQIFSSGKKKTGTNIF
jgi:hypothetical protein